LSERDFIHQFTRLLSDGGGSALQEKLEDGCIFLKDDDCSGQSVKPQQCREFPNLWNFPGFKKVCHAIPWLVGKREFRHRIALIKSKGNERAVDSGASRISLVKRTKLICQV
jgi:Fe-S-cluster containining protein